jgi:ATP-binding cassette, subfamily B, bacterial
MTATDQTLQTKQDRLRALGRAGDKAAQAGNSREAAPLSALLPLAPFALRYGWRMVWAAVALVVAAAATLAIPMAVRRVLDFGFGEENADLVNAYFGMLLFVVAVLSVASATRFYLVMTLGERVVADLRTAVFDQLTRLDAAFYDTARSGELVSRLSADTQQLKSAFGASLSIALRNGMLFIGAVTMMIVTSPTLSAYVLIAIPLIVLPLMGWGRAVRKRSKAAQDALAETSALATEQIGAARTMQAFGAEGRVRGLYARAVAFAYDTAEDSLRARALLTAFVIFVIFACVIGILWMGATAVMAGTISVGRLSQFLLYAVFAASSLSQLSEVWTELSAAAGAAQRLAELLEIEPSVKDPVNPVPLPSPPTGRIVFDRVSFSYPTRPNDVVLGPVSFTIEPGERVALVGPSGAGKTTILQLLQRFYDPSAGQITIDGVEIAKTSLADLRSRLGAVEQAPVIFSGTIADNLRYAAPEASDEVLTSAASKAAALPFINTYAEGLQARVGERGITLSGGERQRLAIARAILKSAPILILDEATSALDAENEEAVQSALLELMRGRTSLVVAHRLATVISADRILVLDHGQIVEEGTHHALVARGGLYARLARLQFDTKRGAGLPAEEPAQERVA